MNSNARKVFDKLKAMGVPVKETPNHGGHFWISSEENNSDEWLDYYENRKDWYNGTYMTM